LAKASTNKNYRAGTDKNNAMTRDEIKAKSTQDVLSIKTEVPAAINLKRRLQMEEAEADSQLESRHSGRPTRSYHALAGITTIGGRGLTPTR
jgi:hypothetical protein